MKRINLIITGIIMLVISGVNAQSLSDLTSAVASGGSLVEDLMKAAQVDKNQALGGAGALFGMAQENMSAKDFEEVANAVPEMDKMLDAIPNTSGKTSMLGTAATALTGMPKVKAAFNKLGISDDKIAFFTPVLVNYVEKNGSKLLGEKLSQALKL